MESWLILKPTAQRPDRTREWINEFVRAGAEVAHNWDLQDCSTMLRTLYTVGGEVQAMFDVKTPQHEGSLMADDLGDNGTELVYFQTIYIHENVRAIPLMHSEWVAFSHVAETSSAIDSTPATESLAMPSTCSTGSCYLLLHTLLHAPKAVQLLEWSS